MSMVLFQAILIMAWLDLVDVRHEVVLYRTGECAEAMDQIAETRPRVAHLGCTALTPPIWAPQGPSVVSTRRSSGRLGEQPPGCNLGSVDGTDVRTWRSEEAPA